MSKHNKDIDHILTWCLHAIEDRAWTVEACLEYHASIKHELEPMLRTTLALRQGRTVTPSPTFQRTARSRLQLRLQASERPPVPQDVTLSAFARFIRYKQNLYKSRRFEMATIIIIIALAVSSVFGGVIYAADVSGPGDMLHGIDLAFENARVKLATSNSGLTKLKLKLAAERLSEVERSLRTNVDHDDIADTLVAFDQLVAELEELLASGNLSSEQQSETRTAILALQEARQALSMGTADEVEIESGDDDNLTIDDEDDGNTPGDNDDNDDDDGNTPGDDDDEDDDDGNTPGDDDDNDDDDGNTPGDDDGNDDDDGNTPGDDDNNDDDDGNTPGDDDDEDNDDGNTHGDDDDEDNDDGNTHGDDDDEDDDDGNTSGDDDDEDNDDGNTHGDDDDEDDDD